MRNVSGAGSSILGSRSRASPDSAPVLSLLLRRYSLVSMGIGQVTKDGYAGWHLAYDAIVESDHVAALTDRDFLRGTLLDLVDLLEMRVLEGPVLHDVLEGTDEGDGEGGLAGMVLLTRGHLALHTWPLRDRFSLGVFLGEKFDETMLQDFLKGRFNVKIRASHWTVRNWP